MFACSFRMTLAMSCSGFALAMGLAQTASADTISLDAKAAYSVGPGGAPTTVEQSTPTYMFPNIFPSASDGSGSSIFGHVYSSQPNGNYQFGSRSSGVKTFSNVGTATYNDSFVAGTSGPYAYRFTIDAGDLNVNLPSSNNGTQYAALSLMITESVDGGPATLLFDYESSMSLSTPGGTPTFSESGAVLNASGPTLSAGYGDYSFGQYSTSVGLGTLTAGQNVTVNEVLIATAVGTTTVCGSGGYGGYGGVNAFRTLVTVGPGGGGICGTSLARIGDPPGVTPPPLPAPVAALAVPEPASLAALGVGLAALAFTRRRRPG